MIYKIQNGPVSAEVDSLGGQLMSFAKGGREYIWQRDPKFWASGAPLLFPVVGRLKNKTLLIDGQEYTMPLHGFLRYTELSVVQQSQSAVTLQLLDSPETLAMYPWKFAFSVTYTLDGNRLTTGIQVENRDRKEMLFAVGGHPGFNVPMEPGAAFEDYQLVFEKEERLESNRVNEDESISAERKDLILEKGRTLPLTRSLFNNDAMIFEDIQSRWVRLVHKDSGRGIHFAYGDFPILAVWTKGEPVEAPYVCLEPWFGMGFRDNETQDITSKYGIQRLAPGQVFQAAFSAEIID